MKRSFILVIIIGVFFSSEVQAADLDFFEGGQCIVYTMPTEDEILDMAKVIYVEARGESFDGKIAVGAVIMNRLKSGNEDFFRNKEATATGVMRKSGAFASFDWVSSDELDEIPDCYLAAQLAAYGMDPTGGCLYFNSDQASIKNKKPDRVYIGNHQFYSKF